MTLNSQSRGLIILATATVTGIKRKSRQYMVYIMYILKKSRQTMSPTNKKQTTLSTQYSNDSIRTRMAKFLPKNLKLLDLLDCPTSNHSALKVTITMSKAVRTSSALCNYWLFLTNLAPRILPTS